MLAERRTHSTCKSGNFIFVSGGINSKGEPLKSCEKFSLEYEKWIKISNMSIAKSHHSLCSFNSEYIFSIGGENRYESLLDVIERYSINVDIWEVMNVKLPLKIECVALVQVNNEILILGGYSCELGSLKAVYTYDTSANTVRKLNKELPQPGWSIYQPVRKCNNIHIFYGGEEDFPPHHVLFQY
jgi:N-acetylneuraminic acid mutarotase